MGARDPDLYETLGVTPEASANDIRKAWRALAKELHPDVAGDDPTRTARFKQVSAAYETLSDPDRRLKYDRARMPRRGPRMPGFGSSFDGAFTGGSWAADGFGGGTRGGARPQPPPPADLDLEDLFTDFQTGDFGFGRKATTEARTAPTPGRDLAVFVDVPAEIAGRGGAVTVSYSRLKRVEGGVMLVRVEELTELRIPPGTANGDTLRVERLGDAGENGGPYGDLVADVRVVGGWGARAGGPDAGGRTGELEVEVEIGVAEAVLGGRVPVETPSGVVRLTIPAGTSSGARFRIRGRGAAAGDVLAVVRIVVPKELDEESRRLIERFAELNPVAPRGS
jgi:DnaJ-class molecular chaperone